MKVLFLDRDGVINHDPGDYTKSVDEFHILPEFLSRAKKWYDAGYKLMVITNQGGIAKGFYTHFEVEAMHQYLQGKCIEAGFRIEAFYYCPHHEVFSGKCLCRKPGSLLIEKAVHAYDVDIQKSIFFGDKQRDLDAAARVGITGVLIEVNTPIPNAEEVNMA